MVLILGRLFITLILTKGYSTILVCLLLSELWWLIRDLSVSRLIEVLVPSLSALFTVHISLPWRNFSLWWVVIVHLLLLFLCVDHTFNLVQDIFIDIGKRFGLLLTLLLTLIFLHVALRLLKEVLGIHLIHDGRDSGARLAEAFQPVKFEVLGRRVFLSGSSIGRSSANFLRTHGWLHRLLRVQYRVYAEECSILLATGERGRTWHRGECVCRLWRRACIGLLRSLIAAFLLAGELRSELFKLQEALDLEVLRINQAFTILINYVHIG